MVLMIIVILMVVRANMMTRMILTIVYRRTTVMTNDWLPYMIPLVAMVAAVAAIIITHDHHYLDCHCYYMSTPIRHLRVRPHLHPMTCIALGSRSHFADRTLPSFDFSPLGPRKL